MGNMSLKVLEKSLNFLFKNGYEPCNLQTVNGYNGTMAAIEHARWGRANYFQQSNFYCFYRVTFSVRPRLRNLQRRLQVNWIWIWDTLIDFTERLFSSYARSSSLNFFVKNKSIRTILLVVLKWKGMPFANKNSTTTYCRSQQNKSKFYFINDLQKTLD